MCIYELTFEVQAGLFDDTAELWTRWLDWRGQAHVAFERFSLHHPDRRGRADLMWIDVSESIDAWASRQGNCGHCQDIIDYELISDPF